MAEEEREVDVFEMREGGFCDVIDIAFEREVFRKYYTKEYRIISTSANAL